MNGASTLMAEQMSGCVPSAAYMSDPIASRYGYDKTVECSLDDAGSKFTFTESGVETGVQLAMPQ